MKKLDAAFYRRHDVMKIAGELLGKVLVTEIDGVLTSGRIVETEAYLGESDRASHAWNGRFTPRTKVMFEEGGLAYVYLCYGIHHLFNVVTSRKGEPRVVLIRALEPLEGLEKMRQRSGILANDQKMTSGPGNLSRALGITVMHTGNSLTSNHLYIADDGYRLSPGRVAVTPRIGVDGAGPEAASFPCRYIIADNPFVSAQRYFSRKKMQA